MVAFGIERDGEDRLRVSGELGFATAAAALHAGFAQLASQREWTVDLGRVDSGDSAGLAVLVEWLAFARARGGAVRYENVPAQMLAIARISELEDLLLAR